jgi:hypothetical protein
MAEPKSKPSLTPVNWGGGGSSALNWPSEQWLITHQVDPTIAGKLGNKPIDMTNYSLTPENYVRAINMQLGNANNRAGFWQDWSRQGFNYEGYASGDKKSKANFRTNVRTFLPDILHAGWDKVDPTQYEMTSGGTLKKSAVIVDLRTGKPVTVPVDSTRQVTALGTIQNELAQWGLQDLTDQVYQKVFKDGINDPKQLTNFIRTTPEYKATFQGLAEYNANTKNVQKITEQQYLMKAQAYMNTAQQYGLPDNFLTRKEIGQLVAGGVSPAEFNRRVVNGYLVAMNADPATKQALAAQGVNFGDLVGYYLDPKKMEPYLTSKANEAQLQGYAQNAGIANLTPTMAQELTQRAKSNLNPDGTFSTAEEKQALDVAAQGQGLTAVAPGSNAQTVDTNQLIGTKLAGFGGTTQAEAQQATQKALQGQEAPFQKAGGFTNTPQGVTGIGSSPQ